MQKGALAKYLGKEIKRHRQREGITQKELGAKVGMAHNTISSYESGTNCPEANILFAIAKELGINIDALFPDSEGRKEVALLPIYKKGEDERAIEGYEPVPKNWIADGEYFFLRAPDNGMSGSRIQKGDLLLIRSQDTISDGEIAAVLIEDKLFVRRVYHQGSQLILQAESLPPILAPKSIVIIGKIKKNIIKY